VYFKSCSVVAVQHFHNSVLSNENFIKPATWRSEKDKAGKADRRLEEEIRRPTGRLII